MHVVYAKQQPPRSWKHAIFLAGPTPRDPETPSWRPKALQFLENMGYDGVVFVPEEATGKWQGSYLDQVEWEKMGLEMADKIVFWVPRDLRTMPAFTTNVEFGRYVTSGKAVLGHPEGAPKTRYLDWLAGENDAPVLETLAATLEAAIKGWDEPGELRKDGERWVPAEVWNTPMFRAWYKQLREVGNRLDEAKVLWTFTIPKHPEFGVFSYILWVKVWIAAESRWKENEWVFARKDLATIVLYGSPPIDPDNGARVESLLGTEIVLVREFRSPVRNADGFVHEVPGGSIDPDDPESAASALRETYEETGLVISKDRLRYIGARQAVSTLSSHQMHCFAAELTEAEMAQAKRLAASEVTFGEEEDSEMTYVEVMTVRELLKGDLLDWSMLGLIFRALVNPYG